MAEQYIPNNNIEGTMSDAQTSQFEDKVVLKAITGAIADEIQEISDAIYQLLTERHIQAAVGAQLDLIGKIVGRSRGGYSDNEYRTLLQLQIGINVSTGTPTALVPIIKEITNSTTVDLFEDYPAAVSAVVNGTNVGSELLSELESVGSAGVDLSIRAIGGDDAFGFEGSSNSLGFGTVHDTELGGNFTSFIEV